MKKYLKITLVTLLMFAIMLSGLLFTQPGNNLLKPFLKAALEKEIGLPVEVNLYTLRYDHTTLKLTVDNTLHVDVKSSFNLLRLSFDGIYTLHGNNFIHKGVNFKQTNMNGDFKGIPDDIHVNGKGIAFSAPLHYSVRILNGDPKELSIRLKDMDIADILALTRKPAFAQGKVDANMTIPTLAKGEKNSHGIIHLHGVTFNTALMQKRFKVTMPNIMAVHGTVDANLTDTEVLGKADLQSNIAHVILRDFYFNKKTKHLISYYLFDILDLKAFSGVLRTKLNGAITLEGNIEKKEHLKVTGYTHTLGGEIQYQVLDKHFTCTMASVPVKNLLHMFRFPAFVDAQASGTIDYNTHTKTGKSKLELEAFRLASNNVTKTIGMMIHKDPTSIVFGDTTLEATLDHDIIHYALAARSQNASIMVNEASIHTKEGAHKAKVTFSYDSYKVTANMNGSIRNPRISLNTQDLLENAEVKKKAKKELKRFLKRLF